VFAFWHGQQMGLLAMPRQRRLATLVSWSRDGALQAGVMRGLGLTVIRGSSSRGGATGLRRLARELKSGSDAAFAVDGPRGPRARAKPGALAAARNAGAELVVVAQAARRCWVLERAWDHFEIPLPFTKVVVVVGGSCHFDPGAGGTLELTRAIEGARARARQLVYATNPE
jgi:lysophospholipid acyltransferase (LPLAT)-like uncharacterized protein